MPQDVSPTYRRQFAEAQKAREYDRVHYGPGSYSDILWDVEQEQLAGIVEGFRRAHPRIDYLDFATGTGRIAAFLEDRVDAATAIDVSAAMAERARERLRRARVICADITAPGTALEGRYDLVTAFRFALNAEPSLRLAAMKALAARLKDRSSLLVFNNHGNLFSHKLPLWPWHRLRGLGRGQRTEGNYMSNGQARRLAAAAGLTIERTLGCGYLSAKSLAFLSRDTVVRLERRLVHVGALRPFGVNQMYVARLAQGR